MNIVLAGYRVRVEKLRSLVAKRAGGGGPPYSPEDIFMLDELTTKFLKCTVPDCYKKVLLEVGSVGAQSSVLYGVDVPIAGDAGKWPVKGIVYASLTWLETPESSPWIAIGENEFEVFAITRDGARFAMIAGGTEVVKREFRSLDDMLSYALDVMLSAYSHA